MLTYDLEKRGSLARYDYLYRCIKEDILSGRLKAGEKLPSKRTLAHPFEYRSGNGGERLCPVGGGGVPERQGKAGVFCQPGGDRTS